MIKAIETHYNGYRFRSRLEARWAVFFDALGIEYQYEPEGFDLGEAGWYLPDFYFPLFDCYAEVKPKTLTLEEFTKCSLLPRECLLLDCVPTSKRPYFATDKVCKRPLDVDYTCYTSRGNFYGWVLLDQSAYKRRLWYLFGEGVDSYTIDSTPERIARSARFEHGESPNLPRL